MEKEAGAMYKNSKKIKKKSLYYVKMCEWQDRKKQNKKYSGHRALNIQMLWETKDKNTILTTTLIVNVQIQQ